MKINCFGYETALGLVTRAQTRAEVKLLYIIADTL